METETVWCGKMVQAEGEDGAHVTLEVKGNLPDLITLHQELQKQLIRMLMEHGMDEVAALHFLLNV